MEYEENEDDSIYIKYNIAHKRREKENDIYMYRDHSKKERKCLCT